MSRTSSRRSRRTRASWSLASSVPKLCTSSLRIGTCARQFVSAIQLRAASCELRVGSASELSLPSSCSSACTLLPYAHPLVRARVPGTCARERPLTRWAAAALCSYKERQADDFTLAVAVEFPTVKLAEAWYTSDTYQALIPTRLKYATGTSARSVQ